MSITLNKQNENKKSNQSEISSIMLLNQQQWAYLRKKYQMTKRELQIAQLVCRGMANDEVAYALGVKLGTVKTHIRNLYRKLWVHNKISMLLKFMKDAGVVIKASDSPIDMMFDPETIVKKQEPSMM